MARRSVRTISSASSPIEHFSCTTIPASFSWRAIETELVSTIYPIRIKSPMVMMVAFME